MRYLIIFFLLIISYSCSKSNLTNTDCNDGNSVLMPDVPKSFFAFKPGTWWIYEDLNNHTFDSVWVGSNTSTKQVMSTDDEAGNRCVEINTTHLYNKKYNLQAQDPAYRTSYVDITIRPLYVTSGSSSNSVNVVVDLSANTNELYPAGRLEFKGNVFNEVKSPNGINHYDSNYNALGIGKKDALILKIFQNDTAIYSSIILLGKIGLYQYTIPSEQKNMILRRYKIVQ